MSTRPTPSVIVAPVTLVSSTVNDSRGSDVRSARTPREMPPPWLPALMVNEPLLATKSAVPAEPATVRQPTTTALVGGTFRAIARATVAVPDRPDGSVTTRSPSETSGRAAAWVPEVGRALSPSSATTNRLAKRRRMMLGPSGSTLPTSRPAVY